ncbi:uncharacterized protein LOC117100164 [Anneissia japonica]|uniref:uncharacterized protein LOC117100164 n=1 Tax=Anneissia japonica TaxID=1529436 RepID=UPI00142599CD|nr:uncharacterized protein LOC117100164 [Anneissia japonica]
MKWTKGTTKYRTEIAAYNGNEGKLCNKGTLSLFSLTSPSTSLASSFTIVTSSTSVSSIAATVPLECSDSDAGLLVGMTFLGFFLGILLSLSIFCDLRKMRNSKAQVIEASSRDYELPTAYTAYKGEPN